MSDISGWWPALRLGLHRLRRRRDAALLRQVVRGVFGLRYPIASHREHMRAAMEWLCCAHDQPGDGGVAALYNLAEGRWAPSYPETTGYIIPTFFDYAAFTGDRRCRDRALAMAEWLLTLQDAAGWFPMGPLWPDLERKPVIFDTGQILFGLVRAFEETGDARFVDAASRACDWLAEVQGADGAWRRFDYLEQTHAYNARVAWGMLRVAQHTGRAAQREAAARNLRWVMAQQTPTGWFRQASFSPEYQPFTHTLAYTIRGLLESSELLGDETMFAAARRAAEALRERQLPDGSLSATYGPQWESADNYTCLTGNVQMGQIWLRLFQLTHDLRYWEAGTRANASVKRRQARNSGQAGVDGGIAGSFPVFGGYERWLYVNWAAKFFVDSLLLEEQLETAKGNAHDQTRQHRPANV